MVLITIESDSSDATGICINAIQYYSGIINYAEQYIPYRNNGSWSMYPKYYTELFAARCSDGASYEYSFENQNTNLKLSFHSNFNDEIYTSAPTCCS